MTIKSDKEWEAQQAAETLTKAKEIEANKKLHTAALRFIIKKQKIEMKVLKGR